MRTVSITSELIDDFMAYSTAIFGRALPDCVDGLKAAQRRSLMGMKDLSLLPTSAYCKVSRLEGHVLGRYHPNGGCANTIINLGQQSAQRYTLSDIHGNCGGTIQTGPCAGQKVSADGPAASRYLEVRATPLSQLVYLSQIDKGLGGWKPNYDGSTSEPIRIVPSLPMLLLTGAVGIAAGFSCHHIPYHINDVIGATIALIKKKDMGQGRFLSNFKSPPEPPQGGRVLKTDDFFEVLKTGRGQVEVYGRWELEDKIPYGKRSYRPGIIITHLASGSSEEFVHKVHELAEREKLQGLITISDHSSRDGIRVEMITKTDCDREELVKVLIAHTGLKHTYSVNSTAVGLNGKPVTLGARESVEIWYDQRVKHLVAKYTKERGVIGERLDRLEGVAKVIKTLDRFIKVVRGAEDKASAITAVARSWKLSEPVATYVIGIPISTLIRTESAKVLEEMDKARADMDKISTLCLPGSDLDTHIISELKELKSTLSSSYPARAEWLDHKPYAQGVAKTPPSSPRDTIIAEAKALGLSTRAINKWLRDNIGQQGGVEKRWTLYREKIVLGSGNDKSNSKSSTSVSGRSRSPKAPVSKRKPGPEGEKRRSGAGKRRPKSTPARSTGGSSSSGAPRARRRTV